MPDMQHDERARRYRRQIDITGALDDLIRAVRASIGEVDAVSGEEYLGAIQRALAAYDALIASGS